MRFFYPGSISCGQCNPCRPAERGQAKKRTKAIVYIDEGILDGNPNLPNQISEYFKSFEASLNLVCPPAFVRGGEEAKNDWVFVESIWADLNKYGLCRHSYVIVVGGGAALDLVGFGSIYRTSYEVGGFQPPP